MQFMPNYRYTIILRAMQGRREDGFFVSLTRFSIAEAYGKSRNKLILHSSSFAFYPEYGIDAC